MATVLVADDDAEVCKLLRVVLEEAQYHVLTSLSGRYAIEMAAARRPDLALIDVRMLDIDGFTVCRVLKAAPETTDLPVIFLTGLHDRAAEREGLLCGAVDYVTKPFAPEVLVERVRRAVVEREQRKALLVENACLRRELASRGGGTPIAPTASSDPDEHAAAQQRPQLPHAAITLTVAECALLTALMAGQRQTELAEAAGVGLRTIERRIGLLKRKLDVQTLAALIARATDLCLRS